jgi:polysaccharide pyruvyl transferase CsaB
MSQRVLISGYYGFNNMGDEAVLAGLLVGLRQVAPTVQPVALSGCPAATSAMHGIESIPRFRMGAVWQALRRSAGLISGGGSLLQDVTSKRSVYYYLGVMAMARLAGRPFCICGQGLGPLRSPLARRMTGRVLKQARSIWVRDHAAGEMVNTLLAGGEVQLYIAADPAFLLPPANEEQGRRALEEAIGRKIGAIGPLWLVAMRPWQNEQRQSYILQALVKAAKTADAGLVFVAMHPAHDQPPAEHLCREAREQGVRSHVLVGSDVRQVCNLLAGADLVIAMRLHALILAVAAGVPGVAVSYDPKVTAFAQELALPCLPLERLDAAGVAVLTRLILDTWTRQAALRTHLQQAVADSRRRARQALACCIAGLGLPTASHGDVGDGQN